MGDPHSPLGDLEGLFLRVADKIDKVVDLSRGVPKCELLLLAVGPYLRLVFDKFVQFSFQAEVALLVSLLVLVIHSTAHSVNVFPNFTEFPGLFVIDILHACALHVLPLELVDQLWRPKQRAFLPALKTTGTRA